MPSSQDERSALLVRLNELAANPSLVHLTDYYVERLLALDAAD